MPNRLFQFAGRLRLVVACLGLIIGFPRLAHAGVEGNLGSPPPVQVAVPSNDRQAGSSPVAVPAPSAKAVSHYRSSLVLLVVEVTWSLALLTGFLFSGASARLRSWAESRGRRWYCSFALYCLVLATGYYVASLPMAWYAGFVHGHAYGLSNQTFSRWFGNSLKAQAIQIVMILALGWIPFRLVRRSPDRWWLYLSLGAIPFICCLCLIQPVVIDPLFNQFQPLPDQALESKILALAARAGIQGSRVYRVDKSVDTSAVNAYVTGFMGTKRIVIWDTAIRALDEDELLFIMGHEMGHYVLGHVVRGIAFSSILVLALLYAVYWLANRAVHRFHARFGFSGLSDVAAAPLGILIIQLLVIGGLPLPMAFSRYQEHEADRFGLELTRNNHAAAMSFVKLQQNNLSIPRPGLLHRLWLGSHPSLAERIEFCNAYRPWATGEAMRYGGRFWQE